MTSRRVFGYPQGAVQSVAHRPYHPFYRPAPSCCSARFTCGSASRLRRGRSWIQHAGGGNWSFTTPTKSAGKSVVLSAYGGIWSFARRTMNSHGAMKSLHKDAGAMQRFRRPGLGPCAGPVSRRGRRPNYACRRPACNAGLRGTLLGGTAHSFVGTEPPAADGAWSCAGPVIVNDPRHQRCARPARIKIRMAGSF